MHVVEQGYSREVGPDQPLQTPPLTKVFAVRSIRFYLKAILENTSNIQNVFNKK